MKKHGLFIIFLFTSLFGYSVNTTGNASLPKDSTAQSTYSVTNEKGIIKLAIEYTMEYHRPTQTKNDTTKKNSNIFEQFFGKSPEKNPKALSETELKEKLMEIVVSNPDLAIEPHFPDDILEIFALIKGKKKKEKAKQIYIKEHSTALINYETSRTMTTKDGVYSSSIKITYRFNLIKKRDTKLVIPGFVHRHDSEHYYSKGFVIDL